MISNRLDQDINWLNKTNHFGFNLWKQMTLEGECFHKTCFRCAHAGCPLTHSNYAALDGVLYCRVHFAQLFMEKGNYNHVLQAAAHRRTGSSTPPLLEEPSQEPAPPASHEDQTEEETPLEWDWKLTWIVSIPSIPFFQNIEQGLWFKFSTVKTFVTISFWVSL